MKSILSNGTTNPGSSRCQRAMRLYSRVVDTASHSHAATKSVAPTTSSGASGLMAAKSPGSVYTGNPPGTVKNGIVSIQKVAVPMMSSRVASTCSRRRGSMPDAAMRVARRRRSSVGGYSSAVAINPAQPATNISTTPTIPTLSGTIDIQAMPAEPRVRGTHDEDEGSEPDGSCQRLRSARARATATTRRPTTVMSATAACSAPLESLR